MAITPPTPTTALPVPPSSNSPGNFDTRADAFLGALPTFQTEENALASNVFNNAVDAANSATAANSSKNAAATSATNAATSATNAGNSATAAASSASSANASAVNASKLNLGDKTSEPSVDNQGAALRIGATYYDTTLGKWRVWTGAAWGDGISAVAGVASLNGRAGNVTLTSTDVGLNNVNNTADSVKAVASAAKLTTARTINGVSFDGQANISIPGNPTVVATSGGVMNCAAGDSFTITVSANTTLSFSNIPSGAYACVLEVVHTSGAITFPAGTVWVGEVTPTLATGKRHLFFFQRAKLGTASWYASALTGFAS